MAKGWQLARESRKQKAENEKQRESCENTARFGTRRLLDFAMDSGEEWLGFAIEGMGSKQHAASGGSAQNNGHMYIAAPLPRSLELFLFFILKFSWAEGLNTHTWESR